MDAPKEVIMRTPSKSLLSLTAADVMSNNIVMIPREMSLQAAARMLARAEVTGAPVVDANGRCIGVLSATDFMHCLERDPVKRHAAQDSAHGICQPWQIPDADVRPCLVVDDYMTADPVLAAPGARIGELARMMIDAHIHRIIVADPVTQRPLGIVSTMDILAALARVEQMQDASTRETVHDIPFGAVR